MKYSGWINRDFTKLPAFLLRENIVVGCLRTKYDRLRHTLFYEFLLLLIVTPLLSFLLKESGLKMGGIGVLFSLMAMGWNYAYNIMFDKILLYLKYPLYPRCFSIRVVHAICFKLGFMTLSIPVVMSLLRYSFLQALTLDFGFLIGIPLYTLLYNWTYDQIFPPLLLMNLKSPPAPHG